MLQGFWLSALCEEIEVQRVSVKEAFCKQQLMSKSAIVEVVKTEKWLYPPEGGQLWFANNLVSSQVEICSEMDAFVFSLQ